MSQKHVSAADTPILFASASNAGPIARKQVWKFMKKKWARISKRYPGQSALRRMVEVSRIIKFSEIVYKHNRFQLCMDIIHN